MTLLADQLLALGLDNQPEIAESAEMVGGRFDPVKTLARLRTRLDFYESELDAMRAFAAKWGAPMEEVTDKDGEYREAASRLRAAITLLDSNIRGRAG